MSRKLFARQLSVEPMRVLNAPLSLDDFDDTSHTTASKTNPYRVGDVVKVDGVDALVVTALVSRIIPGDWLSPILPVCKVRKKTKAGEWSKIWYNAWPGDIERGFEKAGCAA